MRWSSTARLREAEFGDPKYRPCPLLREMAAAGYLGRKTRRGVLPVLTLL
jgi:3-hydroxyacyl-CoA dehydrogenase